MTRASGLFLSAATAPRKIAIHRPAPGTALRDLMCGAMERLPPEVPWRR